MLNAFHSPSPMNELCDYICTWEKRNILWNHDVNNPVQTQCLILNNDLDLSDRKILRICRRYINQYAAELKQHMELHKDKSNDDHHSFHMDIVVHAYRKCIAEELPLEETLIANYVIKASYASISVSKALAWAAYGDYIIANLRNNTHVREKISIQELPYKTDDSYEYLGKYYAFKAGDPYIRM